MNDVLLVGTDVFPSYVVLFTMGLDGVILWSQGSCQRWCQGDISCGLLGTGKVLPCQVQLGQQLHIM